MTESQWFNVVEEGKSTTRGDVAYSRAEWPLPKVGPLPCAPGVCQGLSALGLLGPL